MTMKKKIVFLHPDFGIGGAERLVLDAALATKSKGQQVHIVTNQFSEQHCFTELKEEFSESKPKKLKY
jgi:alpha-1,3/alpha-1,6-mannosyltransferase